MQANKTVVKKGWLAAVLLSCVAAVAIVGCTTTGTDPCAGNPCDDGNLCTTDTCTNSNGVADCSYEDVACSNGFMCDPTDGECVECLEDADCDNGDFCDGTETCADNACVAGMAPECEFGCNEETDACNECAEDSDCADDGNFCTGDPVCTDGACGFTGDPCAADEVCDEDMDTCGAEVVPPADCNSNGDCDATEFCNSDGECEAYECTVDADCDDGLFCNGVETCDTTGFTCVAGTDPCLADETCDEDTETCVAGEAQTFILTVGTDAGAAFTGSSGDDLYLGDLDFTAGAPGVQTLGVNDQLDGGSGTDELRATISSSVTPAALDSIEVIQITNTAAVNPTLTNAPDVTTLKTTGNTNAISFLGIQNTIADFDVANNGQAVTFTLADTALSGSSDVCTVGVSSVTAGAVVIQPSTAAKSGYETVTFNSMGAVTNQFTFNDGNGNSLKTIYVMGSANLDINGAGLDTTVTTVDASAATGDVDVLVPGDGVAGTAITVTGGAGDDDLDCTDTADEYFTVDAGAGDDKVTFNANYDSTSPFTDTVDGGDGEDTLSVTSADATTTTSQTSATNFEILQVSNQLAGNVDLSYWGSDVMELNLAAGIDGTARTITLPDGGTVNIDADAGAANHVLTIGDTATDDAATLDLADGVDFGAALSVNGIEVLTIAGPTTAGTKNDFVGAVTMTASAGGSTKMILTGANELEFSAALTVGIVDGSACTGVIDIQAAPANAVSLSGGSADDILTGSASADVINGNAGADTIDANDGDDVITGGAGADTFQFTAGDQSGAPSATVFVTITDFEKDSDIFDETVGALVIVSGSSASAGTAAVSAEGICTFHADDDTLAERITACEAGINASGVAAARQFAVFEHSTNSYLFVSDGTDGVGANDMLFKLTGVTGLTDTTLSGGNLTIK